MSSAVIPSLCNTSVRHCVTKSVRHSVITSVRECVAKPVCNCVTKSACHSVTKSIGHSVLCCAHVLYCSIKMGGLFNLFVFGCHFVPKSVGHSVPNSVGHSVPKLAILCQSQSAIL